MELSPEQRSEMDQLVTGMRTKSEKIRALGRAGFRRQEIANFLDIRYQHVRNVLVAAEEKERRQQSFPTSQESAGADARAPEWVPVGPDGRIVIPAAHRRRLGIPSGGKVLMILDDGAVRLLGPEEAVRRAQALVARYVPEGVSLSEDLIAERRAEARREEGDGPGHS